MCQGPGRRGAAIYPLTANGRFSGTRLCPVSRRAYGSVEEQRIAQGEYVVIALV